LKINYFWKLIQILKKAMRNKTDETNKLYHIKYVIKWEDFFANSRIAEKAKLDWGIGFTPVFSSLADAEAFRIKVGVNPPIEVIKLIQKNNNRKNPEGGDGG